jgi:hypothetical protein
MRFDPELGTTANSCDLWGSFDIVSLSNRPSIKIATESWCCHEIIAVGESTGAVFVPDITVTNKIGGSVPEGMFEDVLESQATIANVTKSAEAAARIDRIESPSN